jgi:hypothetical protein
LTIPQAGFSLVGLANGPLRSTVVFAIIHSRAEGTNDQLQHKEAVLTATSGRWASPVWWATASAIDHSPMSDSHHQDHQIAALPRVNHLMSPSRPTRDAGQGTLVSSGKNEDWMRSMQIMHG